MFGYAIANYEMVSREQDLEFPALGSFKLIIYGAYNAYGMIGSEQNGIAILDNQKMQILCDRICPQDTGYFGPSSEQQLQFNQLCEMDETQFQEFVNANPRTRYEI